MFIDDDGPTLEQSYDVLMLQRSQNPAPAVQDSLALAMAACSSDDPALVQVLLRAASARSPDPDHRYRWAEWAVYNDRALVVQALIAHHGLNLYAPTSRQEPLFALIDRQGGPGVTAAVDAQDVPWTVRWTLPAGHREVTGPMNRLSWLILAHPQENLVDRTLALLERPEVQQDRAMLDHALRCAATVSPRRSLSNTFDLSPVVERLLQLGARLDVVWADPPGWQNADHYGIERPGRVEEVWALRGDPAQDAQILGEHGRAAVPDPNRPRTRWDRGPVPLAHRPDRGWTTAHAWAHTLGENAGSTFAVDLASRIDWSTVPLDAFGRSPLAVMLHAQNHPTCGLYHQGLISPSPDPSETMGIDPTPSPDPSTTAWARVAAAGWPAGHVAWEPLRMAMAIGLERGDWLPFDAIQGHAPARDARLSPPDLLEVVSTWLTAVDDRVSSVDMTETMLNQIRRTVRDDRQRVQQLLDWTDDAGRALLQPWIERVAQTVEPAILAMVTDRRMAGPMSSISTLREGFDATMTSLTERLTLEQEALSSWNGQGRTMRPRL